jgi:hypothetical protein
MSFWAPDFWQGMGASGSGTLLVTGDGVTVELASPQFEVSLMSELEVSLSTEEIHSNVEASPVLADVDAGPITVTVDLDSQEIGVNVL